ncbi:type II toxin-antitoxin system PemK/MazF family toxin [Ornithinicoccus hortensis]|uniref:PemK-like, MazF-like toxin of type II toxin-antitoxin system n=1 Tax=Ornithinicoccus hortensis TaxID=82346 RepID=A0A542YRZ7_9MICO|nr:type II toxin-antitoxin system PemK/MazF family toxin [Ornithinicoccus hortensis]TQL50848.1 PemK-like, MazF-like toxin of type II toxin-antitoxin system [Ornithinicoccus hortensis]
MSAPAGLRRFLQHAVAAARSAARAATQKGRRGGRDGRRPTGGPGSSAGYPGDFTGAPQISYTPVEDGEPDPGEVVWTWVPFEEDHSQGKDRPVLVIGRDDRWLLALQMTSKDHDRDAADEARWGRYWVDVGAGGWDRERRPSEARVDRILRIDPGAVRRIGAVLDRDRFEEVASAVRERTG